MVIQILNVVTFFHLQGVVHRDLKPEVTLYQAYVMHFGFVYRFLICKV